MDCNVIVIDWSVGASGDYINAARHVPLAGVQVGELIDWMNVLGAPFSNFHVLGHSLGGHVAGITGRSTKKGVVEYITGNIKILYSVNKRKIKYFFFQGLDPACPLWGNDSQRIRPSDGKYVEIIHTNGGQWGLMEPIGDTDFYPNGGIDMPGCTDIVCSHHRAFFYIADSIDHQRFMADKCDNVEEILNDSCSNSGKWVHHPYGWCWYQDGVSFNMLKIKLLIF